MIAGPGQQREQPGNESDRAGGGRAGGGLLLPVLMAHLFFS
jgi:hypothetical protein